MEIPGTDVGGGDGAGAPEYEEYEHPTYSNNTCYYPNKIGECGTIVGSLYERKSWGRIIETDEDWFWLAGKGAGPGAGTAADASLLCPDSIMGSDRAARDAEDAFTKVLLESLLSFIAVLLLKCCYKDIIFFVTCDQ